MFGIRLENVTKRFDNVLALDRINLEIDAGEFFFLLGHLVVAKPRCCAFWRVLSSPRVVG